MIVIGRFSMTLGPCPERCQPSGAQDQGMDATPNGIGMTSGRSSQATSVLVQRLRQVADDVLRVLQPHREAEDAVASKGAIRLLLFAF